MAQSVNSLSRKLKPLLSNLREGLGINIAIVRNTAGDRKLRGTYFLRVSLVSQISSPCSPSSPDQIHEGNQAQNGEDISGGEDTYLHPEVISSPKSTENHAQNPKGEDGEDSEDIFSTKVFSTRVGDPPPSLSEEEKVKLLRDYEDLSAKSRAESNRAKKEFDRI